MVSIEPRCLGAPLPHTGYRSKLKVCCLSDVIPVALDKESGVIFDMTR